MLDKIHKTNIMAAKIATKEITPNANNTVLMMRQTLQRIKAPTNATNNPTTNTKSNNTNIIFSPLTKKGGLLLGFYR